MLSGTCEGGNFGFNPGSPTKGLLIFASSMFSNSYVVFFFQMVRAIQNSDIPYVAHISISYELALYLLISELFHNLHDIGMHHPSSIAIRCTAYLLAGHPPTHNAHSILISLAYTTSYKSMKSVCR